MIRYEDPNEEIEMMHIERTERDDEDLYDAVLRYRNEHPEEEDKWEAKERLHDAAPELLEALINQLEEIGVDPFGSIWGFSHKTQAAILAVQKATGKKEETL